MMWSDGEHPAESPFHALPLLGFSLSTQLPHRQSTCSLGWLDSKCFLSMYVVALTSVLGEFLNLDCDSGSSTPAPTTVIRGKGWAKTWMNKRMVAYCLTALVLRNGIFFLILFSPDLKRYPFCLSLKSNTWMVMVKQPVGPSSPKVGCAALVAPDLTRCCRIVNQQTPLPLTFNPNALQDDLITASPFVGFQE